MSDQRRIIVRSGPGSQLLLAIEPPFPVSFPVLCAGRSDILGFAKALSKITDWPLVNEVDTLQ